MAKMKNAAAQAMPALIHNVRDRPAMGNSSGVSCARPATGAKPDLLSDVPKT